MLFPLLSLLVISFIRNALLTSLISLFPNTINAYADADRTTYTASHSMFQPSETARPTTNDSWGVYMCRTTNFDKETWRGEEVCRWVNWAMLDQWNDCPSIKHNEVISFGPDPGVVCQLVSTPSLIFRMRRSMMLTHDPARFIRLLEHRQPSHRHSISWYW